MTQYEDRVEYQRLKLKAEAWANGVKCIHAHSLSSLWYDDRPQDTEKHSVTDTEYMSGKIERTLHDGTRIVLVEGATGEKLVSTIEAQLTDRGEAL